MPKLSVIVAVYNAGKYIRRCAESLFSQTLDDIEYIFINDCTQDESFVILDNIISEYPERANSIRIITHNKNMGVAASRSDGMKLASGEYITHCDPDDWIDVDAYKKAYETAIRNNADIVTFGYRVHSKNNITEDVVKACNGSGLEIINQWNFTTVLWNSIVRNSIIKDNSIYPFDGINSGEDTNVILRAYLFAEKVCGLNEVFYHYNCTNDNSITSISYRENLEKFVKPNIASLESWFRDNNQPMEIIDKLKSAIKGDILFRSDVADVKLAYNTWPEANRYWSNLNWYSKKTQGLIKLGIQFPGILSLIFDIKALFSKYFNRCI